MYLFDLMNWFRRNNGAGVPTQITSDFPSNRNLMPNQSQQVRSSQNNGNQNRNAASNNAPQQTNAAPSKPFEYELKDIKEFYKDPRHFGGSIFDKKPTSLSDTELKEDIKTPNDVYFILYETKATENKDVQRLIKNDLVLLEFIKKLEKDKTKQDTKLIESEIAKFTKKKERNFDFLKRIANDLADKKVEITIEKNYGVIDESPIDSSKPKNRNYLGSIKSGITPCGNYTINKDKEVTLKNALFLNKHKQSLDDLKVNTESLILMNKGLQYHGTSYAGTNPWIFSAVEDIHKEKFRLLDEDGKPIPNKYKIPPMVNVKSLEKNIKTGIETIKSSIESVVNNARNSQIETNDEHEEVFLIDGDSGKFAKNYNERYLGFLGETKDVNSIKNAQIDYKGMARTSGSVAQRHDGMNEGSYSTPMVKMARNEANEFKNDLEAAKGKKIVRTTIINGSPGMGKTKAIEIITSGAEKDDVLSFNADIHTYEAILKKVAEKIEDFDGAKRNGSAIFLIIDEVDKLVDENGKSVSIQEVEAKIKESGKNIHFSAVSATVASQDLEWKIGQIMDEINDQKNQELGDKINNNLGEYKTEITNLKNAITDESMGKEDRIEKITNAKNSFTKWVDSGIKAILKTDPSNKELKKYVNLLKPLLIGVGESVEDFGKTINTKIESTIATNTLQAAIADSVAQDKETEGGSIAVIKGLQSSEVDANSMGNLLKDLEIKDQQGKKVRIIVDCLEGDLSRKQKHFNVTFDASGGFNLDPVVGAKVGEGQNFIILTNTTRLDPKVNGSNPVINKVFSQKFDHSEKQINFRDRAGGKTKLVLVAEPGQEKEIAENAQAVVKKRLISSIGNHLDTKNITKESAMESFKIGFGWITAKPQQKTVNNVAQSQTQKDITMQIGTQNTQLGNALEKKVTSQQVQKPAQKEEDQDNISEIIDEEDLDISVDQDYKKEAVGNEDAKENINGKNGDEKKQDNTSSENVGANINAPYSNKNTIQTLTGENLNQEKAIDDEFDDISILENKSINEADDKNTRQNPHRQKKDDTKVVQKDDIDDDFNLQKLQFNPGEEMDFNDTEITGGSDLNYSAIAQREETHDDEDLLSVLNGNDNKRINKEEKLSVKEIGKDDPYEPDYIVSELVFHVNSTSNADAIKKAQAKVGEKETSFYNSYGYLLVNAINEICQNNENAELKAGVQSALEKLQGSIAKQADDDVKDKKLTKIEGMLNILNSGQFSKTGVPIEGGLFDGLKKLDAKGIQDVVLGSLKFSVIMPASEIAKERLMTRSTASKPVETNNAPTNLNSFRAIKDGALELEDVKKMASVYLRGGIYSTSRDTTQSSGNNNASYVGNENNRSLAKTNSSFIS